MPGVGLNADKRSRARAFLALYRNNSTCLTISAGYLSHCGNHTEVKVFGGCELANACELCV